MKLKFQRTFINKQKIYISFQERIGERFKQTESLALSICHSLTYSFTPVTTGFLLFRSLFMANYWIVVPPRNNVTVVEINVRNKRIMSEKCHVQEACTLPTAALLIAHIIQ